MTDAMAVTDDDRELIDIARRAAGHSYSPYSRFPVGAALRLRDGAIVIGTNVETGSYSSVCAERSALVAARAAQGPSLAVDTLAVTPLAPDVRSCSPCGSCRDMISELMPRDGRIVFLYEGDWAVHTVAELVTFPFEMGGSDVD